MNARPVLYASSCGGLSDHGAVPRSLPSTVIKTVIEASAWWSSTCALDCEDLVRTLVSVNRDKNKAVGMFEWVNLGKHV